MLIFILFLVSIGTIVELLGLLSVFISSFMGSNEFIHLLIQFSIMIVFLSLYILALEKVFLKLYKDMRLSYKVLTIKEKSMKRIMLLGLMLIHFLGLSWLESNVSSLLHFVVLTLFLSLFFGFGIKGLFDEVYQIKLLKEGNKIISEER